MTNLCCAEVCAARGNRSYRRGVRAAPARTLADLLRRHHHEVHQIRGGAQLGDRPITMLVGRWCLVEAAVLDRRILRQRRDPNTVETARARPVDDTDLVGVQQRRNVSGARVRREAHEGEAAGSRLASAAALAEKASWRGVRLAKNSPIRATKPWESAGLRPACASITANSRVAARGEGWPSASLSSTVAIISSRASM